MKAKYPKSILSVKSAILVQRGGMFSWRCWILGLPGSLSRVYTIYVRMFSMCIFASYLSDTHLHTSIINCLGLVFISWESVFFRVSRDREALYRLILGEGKEDYTSSRGGGLLRVMKWR